MATQRHIFDQNIKQRLKPLFIADNYNGIMSVLFDWMVVAIAIKLNEFLSSYNIFIGIILYPVTLLVVGGRMRALACILHYSTHRALAKSKLLNDILGTIFSGWWMLQSWTGYYQNHIVYHHPYLGKSDKDPDYQQIIQTGLYSENTTKADVMNYMKSIPSPKLTIEYITYLVKDRIFPQKEATLETILRLFFYLTVVTIVYQTGNLISFIIYWIIPFLTTANWIGNITEFLEHFPLLTRYDNELYLSRNRICSKLEDFFFGPHADGYHLVHHLFPKIPHWNLKQAHTILMDSDSYKILHQEKKIGMNAVIQDVLSYFD